MSGARRQVLVAGVDESGIGPLAGPVTAAAVILKPGTVIKGLRDSKLLDARTRDGLFERISAEAVSVGVGMVDIDDIYKLNILNASLKAMRLAINALLNPPGLILVDGIRIIPDLDIKQQAIVKGDTRIPEIMAASIIAKVTRDRIMIDYSLKYPGYGFENHKGYGTAQHIKVLKKLGPCPIHRRGYTPVRDLIADGGKTSWKQ
jgi:ribonuclease HII